MFPKYSVRKKVMSMITAEIDRAQKELDVEIENINIEEEEAKKALEEKFDRERNESLTRKVFNFIK